MKKQTVQQDDILVPRRRTSKRWDKHLEKQDEIRLLNISKARANVEKYGN